MLSSRERRAVVREILMMARLSEPPRPLESIPLTVITAGRKQIPGWREMQDELAALSADSTHLVADDAGHYVHLDAPESRHPGHQGHGPQGRPGLAARRSFEDLASLRSRSGSSAGKRSGRWRPAPRGLHHR